MDKMAIHLNCRKTQNKQATWHSNRTFFVQFVVSSEIFLKTQDVTVFIFSKIAYWGFFGVCDS
jgi:hypothetical protein